ncbi:helix-turn-helix transcriptional regulator [Aurantiacibacter gangjinensis]|uniref:helix-turn-helix transcriptional regulator n=1 Tax=Aurantiacibacter gangjinensis TaxID=502682 RepID=UPI00069B9573|nr:LuxR family transcriptional regulator [Aurantiacibacter gangjinensis]
MQRIVSAIDRCSEIGCVFDVVREASQQFGAARHSYHFTPKFERQTSLNTIVNADGFPDKWVSIYEDYSFRKSDPIPDFVMRAGKVQTWSAVMEMQTDHDDPRIAEYFRAMRDFGLSYGVGIPLFGPAGRDAYASFGFHHDPGQDDSGRIAILRTIMQAAHQKICVLQSQAEAREQVELSARESHVMYWIAQGKSNTDIAEILGISPHTIGTYIKRIFEKLDASDRVSATVRALKAGLITLEAH